VNSGVEAAIEGRQGVHALVRGHARQDGAAAALTRALVGGHLADDGRHFEALLCVERFPKSFKCISKMF